MFNMRFIFHFRPWEFFLRKNWYGKRFYKNENEMVYLFDCGAITIGWARPLRRGER